MSPTERKWDGGKIEMKHLERRKGLAVVQILIAVFILILGIIWSNEQSDIPENIKESNLYKESYIYSRTKSLKINSIEEWIDFSNDVRNGMDYNDYNIYLMEDLDFKYSEKMMSVGDKENPFRGSLYGNDHIISNLKLSSEEEYVGLFGVTEDALIQELSLQNCAIDSFYATGTGGIVGFAQRSRIENCIFNGKLFAENGSVGGIIGNNHSLVYRCTVYGDILGNVQNGTYTTEEIKGSYGTGGITGDNGYIILQCKNYADVSDDSAEHESNTIRSGGISGYNNGRIDSCVNYGKITGGGITENNSEYGTIRCCFNIGDVYSGISIGSYQDSVIEYCVNMGQAEGRYAGDVVSFWGQDLENNSYGCISNCLYINSAKAGVARKKSFGDAKLHDNKKIEMPDEKAMAQFDKYMERNDYYNAYRFLEEKRKEGRIIFIFKIFLFSTLSFFIVRITIKIKKWICRKRLYGKGVSFFEEECYWESYKLLCECADYKNSEAFLKKSINTLLMEGRKTGILWLGECMGNTIQWHKMKEEHGNIYFLSANALAVDRIHIDTKLDKWEDSELSKKINSVYKEKWFGKNIDGYLEMDISIPEIEAIKELYPLSQQRKCENSYKIEGALMSAGHVYWWLKSCQQSEKMPFVTADGLISEKGKLLTDTNIALRPMIKIRGIYENNS